MSNVSELSWGLVIATYQREKVLLRCLHFATQQTQLPQEIIVIDASYDWEKTRHKVMHELVEQYPAIDWKYQPAHKVSLTAQRNQGIALATADILFLIDDDSFMYPNCAAEIMQIYSHDSEQQVVGIMCQLAAHPFGQITQFNEQLSLTNTWNKVANKIKKILFLWTNWINYKILRKVDFICYDFPSPQYALPKALQNQGLNPIRIMHGARMTYRRTVFTQIRFEESLEYIAIGEDVDLGCRALRLGMLLHAPRAQLYHMVASDGRLSRLLRRALWVLNQVALHRLNSSDLARSRKLLPKMFWHQVVVDAIKDILVWRWTLPSARGVLIGLKYHKVIFNMDSKELRRWYPKFQQDLVNRFKK